MQSLFFVFCKDFSFLYTWDEGVIHINAVPKETRRGWKSLGSGVKGGCKPPGLGAGNRGRAELVKGE